MKFPVGAGLLEACVLSVAHRGDTYGYQLTQALKDIVGLSESTLYPVLRRLMQNGLLECYDMPVDGRNRRYYRVTPSGNSQHGEYKEAWNEYKQALDKIILEDTYE